MLTATTRTILTVNKGKESILRMSSRSKLNSEFCNVLGPFSSAFCGSQFMVGLSDEESSSEALTVNALSSVFDIGTSSSMGECGASGRTVVAETGVGVLRPVGPAELGCCCSTESEDLRLKPTAREPVYNQKFQKLYKSIYITKTV